MAIRLHKMLQQFMLLSFILSETEATPAISQANHVYSAINFTFVYPFAIQGGSYINNSYLVICFNVTSRPRIWNTTNLKGRPISHTRKLQASLPKRYAKRTWSRRIGKGGKRDGGNTAGGYTCVCPRRFIGGGNGCNTSTRLVFMGIIVGTVTSLVVTVPIYCAIKQSQILKQRDNFFKQNGGIMLQKMLFKCRDSTQIAQIFTEEELKKATDNFNQSNVIGQGGYGIVYKGRLPNKIWVAIKKSKVNDKCQMDQFVNEVIILSQISHPNVVKLLGCCLETHTPLLVYEFISNNTLFHHLHEKGSASMTFEMRLNIATKTAEALAHMHSTMNIIHRDIKSSNILLTDDYNAKVSDFGISRFVPLDKTHLSTIVHGTLGYIDPEYFRSGILTEKSDVYSFGIVLIELLTGEKVFSLDRTESYLGLAALLASSMEGGCLVKILDDHVKESGHAKQINGVAELAKLCTNLEGKKRPRMNDVKEKLEGLICL